MDFETTFIAQVITVIGFAVGLSIVVASGRYPRHIRNSLRAYAYGKFLLGFGFLIAGLRGSAAPDLLVPLANGLGITGLAMNYTSVRHLQSRPVSPLAPAAVGLAVAVACLLLLFVDAGIASVRTLVSFTTAAVLLGIAFEVLVRYEGRGIPHYVTGVLCATLAMVYLVRMGAGLTQEETPTAYMLDDRVERTTFLLTLLGTVTGAINYVLMASDEFNRELAKLAHTDGLTGSLNRRRLFEMGEIEFRRARRHGRDLTVLVLDIDRFKSINDRAGHPFGDRVIQAVADCCAGQIRREDAMGRIGGEEFAILLPETGLEAGRLLAERLRSAIERQLAQLGAEGGVTVTCSIGGVSLTREHSEFSDLMAQSDSALYDAKHAGRNQVRFFPTVSLTPALHA
ncbi:diguanylate cyclase [Azospirillum sp. TSH100]|uniref:GGDEF domain-containing protein n=1 Tax=Azospirillum sp. TSH100 TaxID=652764 RepID=UPI000D6207CE|nr:GGDEF domain-containing protein [Azospirillum sp. TSH100]PWC86149.1 diguanylate cyclase [Azospirillum sp. TSH100]QCG89568.1 GGDEF domain-containing protein [Azospirillum sp. TSH100]